MEKIGHAIIIVLLGLALASPTVFATTHYYDFIIKESSYTRLCHTKNILTVNGSFPGPIIYAHKQDTVIVNVHNEGDMNVTLHWHGVEQHRNPWYDGPEYVTQCPIKPGANFTYTILLSEEEGTLWWHAHSDWSRATLHGAIIIHPKIGTTFPFPTPDKEIPIIISEWWNTDINAVIEDFQLTGGAPINSECFTINGEPGHLSPCSQLRIFTEQVEYGQTYLLRLVNAAMNNELFFGVAGHNLTVVGTDASYLKPFTTDYIFISPGQTMDVLLHANANTTSNPSFYMAASAYYSSLLLVEDAGLNTTTATGIIQYTETTPSDLPPLMPNLPDQYDTDAVTKFAANLRSLASKEHPANVPTSIDKRIIIAVSLNKLPCSENITCTGPFGDRFSASLNNISYVQPGVDVLEAYSSGINGVYSTNFPKKPLFDINFTGDIPTSMWVTKRNETAVRVLEYNSSVEVVFQGTSMISGMDHPMHLHGHSFYVVGRGSGNYDEKKDPSSYKLVDPPYQNTVLVPQSGWAAIRFIADNPGVWFMHCHFELHTTWGMDTIFIVKNGPTADAQMLPKPSDMPPC